MPSDEGCQASIVHRSNLVLVHFLPCPSPNHMSRAWISTNVASSSAEPMTF